MDYELEADGFAKVSGASVGTVKKLQSMGFALRGVSTYADGERFTVDLWPEDRSRPTGSGALRRALGLPVLVMEQKPEKTFRASVTAGSPPEVKVLNTGNAFSLYIEADKSELLTEALRKSGLRFSGPQPAGTLARFTLAEPNVTVEKFASAMKGFRVTGPDGQAVVGSFDDLAQKLGGVKPKHLVLG